MATVRDNYTDLVTLTNDLKKQTDLSEPTLIKLAELAFQNHFSSQQIEISRFAAGMRDGSPNEEPEPLPPDEVIGEAPEPMSITQLPAKKGGRSRGNA